MSEIKERLTYRPEPETRRKIEQWYAATDCRSMNDFIEKAVNFYVGYLEAGDDNAFLPTALRSVIDGSIGKFENHMSYLLFKQAVETDMLSTLIAHDYELSEEAMRRLRAKSVRDVKATKGRISFEQRVREDASDDLFRDEDDPWQD